MLLGQVRRYIFRRLRLFKVGDESGLFLKRFKAEKLQVQKERRKSGKVGIPCTLLLRFFRNGRLIVCVRGISLALFYSTRSFPERNMSPMPLLP